MSDTTILEGPDGRLYEIPKDKLAEFAVPGERVAELRRRMAGGGVSTTVAEPAGGPSSTPPGMPRGIPPGHTAMPPGHTAMPPTSMSINPGGGVVLNFYFQASPPAVAPGRLPNDLADGLGAAGDTAHGGHNGEVQGYHMSFDESGIPVNHTDMLWGDYIDKQGNPAVGWHSHDPVTGNAQ